jgi:hypothetical protein
LNSQIIDFDPVRALTESYHLRSYKMKMGKQTTDATKAAAIYMLKNGLASYKEIAELSGRSRQIIVSAKPMPFRSCSSKA